MNYVAARKRRIHRRSASSAFRRSAPHPRALPFRPGRELSLIGARRNDRVVTDDEPVSPTTARSSRTIDLVLRAVPISVGPTAPFINRSGARGFSSPAATVGIARRIEIPIGRRTKKRELGVASRVDVSYRQRVGGPSGERQDRGQTRGGKKGGSSNRSIETNVGTRNRGIEAGIWKKKQGRPKGSTKSTSNDIQKKKKKKTLKKKK